MWTWVVHTLLLESHLEERRLGSSGLLGFISFAFFLSHSLPLCLMCELLFHFLPYKEVGFIYLSNFIILIWIWFDLLKVRSVPNSSLGMNISFAFSYFMGFLLWRLLLCIEVPKIKPSLLRLPTPRLGFTVAMARTLDHIINFISFLDFFFCIKFKKLWITTTTLFFWWLMVIFNWSTALIIY